MGELHSENGLLSLHHILIELSEVRGRWLKCGGLYCKIIISFYSSQGRRVIQLYEVTPFSQLHENYILLIKSMDLRN